MENYKEKLGNNLGDREREEMIVNFIPERISNTDLFLNSMQLVIQFLRNKLKEKCVRFYDNL